MEDRSGPLIYLLCAPNGRVGMARRFIYRVPLMEDRVARRFIKCVPLMEDRSGS